MVEVQKQLFFFAISAVPARPSAGIGVVEVQKQMFFFAISAVPARPSAGIGVVEVQKLEVFLRFLRCSRNPLRESASRCAKNQGFLRLLLLKLPAGRGFDSSLVRGRASQDATCILKQLAQSNLRRPTCTDQCAQSALPRATCAEQLTQSNLHRATCTEQLAQSNLQGAQFAQSNLQGATCRGQLAGATCAEQLAQSNLHSAACAEQLAQSNLRRPTCTDQCAQSALPGAVPRLLHKCFVEGKRTHPAALGRPRLRCYAFGPTLV